MTGRTVNGSEKLARSGGGSLLLLAAPLNSPILRSLAGGPRQLVELQREAGFPAQTTLRAQLRRLIEAGAVEKHRRNRFPGVLRYELTTAGEELLRVAAALDRWLEHADNGPLELGGRGAKAAIKALVEGWSTPMLRALAGNDLSLTELDRLIGSLSYPSLERRLVAMRLAGLVRASAPNGRSTPYSVTGWAREGMGPLLSATDWEERHAAGPATISRLEVETAMLLAVPPMRVPGEHSGACRLAVDLGDAPMDQSGIVATLDDGRVTACSTRLKQRADAWAVGSALDWIDSLCRGEAAALEIGGVTALARSLVSALREAYAPFLIAGSN